MPISINTEISLGHILILVGMLGGIAAQYSTYQARMTSIESSIKRQETTSEDMARLIGVISRDIAVIRHGKDPEKAPVPEVHKK